MVDEKEEILSNYKQNETKQKKPLEHKSSKTL